MDANLTRDVDGWSGRDCQGAGLADFFSSKVLDDDDAWFPHTAYSDTMASRWKRNQRRDGTVPSAPNSRVRRLRAAIVTCHTEVRDGSKANMGNHNATVEQRPTSRRPCVNDE